MRKCLLLLLLLKFGMEGMVSAQEPGLFSFEHAQMGTLWKLQFVAADSLQAKEVAQQAFQLLDDLNQIFSDYDSQSELSKFNARAGDGSWVSISPQLHTVLSYAKTMHQNSDGAFDITIGPLSKIWRKAFRRQTFPDVEKLARAKLLVNTKWLRLKKKEAKAKLKKAEMRLDAGGIAKGYALDQIGEFLERKGIFQYLIDGGGDLLLGQPPNNTKGWTIGFPDGSGRLLKACAVATSGSKYRYLQYEGKRYSHLIDPRTAYGVTEEKSNTVIAATGMMADAWASALSILNKKEIEQLARRKLAGIQYHIF